MGLWNNLDYSFDGHQNIVFEREELLEIQAREYLTDEIVANFNELAYARYLNQLPTLA